MLFRSQRFLRSADRNAGFVATDSARALIIPEPILGSSAHEGTSPHLTSASSRPLPSRAARTVGTICVGAMLYRGDHSTELKTAKISASSAGETRKVYRPHMDAIVATARPLDCNPPAYGLHEKEKGVAQKRPDGREPRAENSAAG